MVHKLRNRDVCHTCPRPNLVRNSLIKTYTHVHVAHSTPDYNKILKRSVLVDLSNVEGTSMVRLNQRGGGISNTISTIFNDLNNSKSDIMLHTLIDEYIFSHTFGKRSGVSLHAVKKSLREEQPNNSNRTYKNVSRYIAFGIKSGKLQQITGHGAAGTFRLNRSIHNSHLERLRRLRKVSLQSHTIQRKNVIKQAQHNTVL